MNILLLLALAAASTSTVTSSTTAPAPQVEPRRLLVFSFAGEGVEPRVVRSVERAVVQSADDAGYEALSNQDIAAVLDVEAAKQAAGCDGASSCMAEVAGGMGASLVVTGTVVALDTSHFELSLTLLGDNATRVVARASGTASSAAALRDEATRTADRLWREAQASTSKTAITSTGGNDRTSAIVWISGGVVGVVGGGIVGVLGGLNAINAVAAREAATVAAAAYEKTGSPDDAGDVVAAHAAYTSAADAWNTWGRVATIAGGAVVVGGLVAAGVGVAQLME